jgi:L-seryl-tRNA(Ser) seleniumtransferase
VGGRDDTEAGGLRSLPAVHELAATLDAPHALAVAAARAAIDEARTAIRAGGDPDADLRRRAGELLAELERESLRSVINATGVIIHTNLGRAPLAAAAQAAVGVVAGGYSSLELELGTGVRGSRQTHVERLLTELSGAEAALVVNNGAGAVLLATAALAGQGGSVVVSRGQLVEIGGGFRIPDVVAQSGAKLVEVGTTNRTRIEDYEAALADDTRCSVILRVHPSNFRSLGFVEEVAIEALCALGRPVIDDVGSGVLADANGIPALGDEPSLKRSVAAGAAIVCCSGDKLLGGPQAGLLLGRDEAIAAAARHPLARALRIDKLSLAALEATLRLYRDPVLARREIPVLAMLDVAPAELARRAERLRDGIGPTSAEVVSVSAKVGGGALPLLELEGPAVALPTSADPAATMGALREHDPPVIARVHDGRVVFDPRTLRDEDLEAVIAAARAALAQA